MINVIAMFQTLSAELEGTGVNIQVVCPDVVATEFHERQGMDLSRVRRMTADDIITTSLPSAHPLRPGRSRGATGVSRLMSQAPAGTGRVTACDRRKGDAS